MIQLLQFPIQFNNKMMKNLHSQSYHSQSSSHQKLFTTSAHSNNKSLSIDQKLDQDFVKMLASVEQRYTKFNKHKWVQKMLLCDENTMFRKRRNCYIQLLNQMVQREWIAPIFLKMPPGELPNISDHEYKILMQETKKHKLVPLSRSHEIKMQKIEEPVGDNGTCQATPCCQTDRSLINKNHQIQHLLTHHHYERLPTLATNEIQHSEILDNQLNELSEQELQEILPSINQCEPSSEQMFDKMYFSNQIQNAINPKSTLYFTTNDKRNNLLDNIQVLLKRNADKFQHSQEYHNIMSMLKEKNKQKYRSKENMDPKPKIKHKEVNQKIVDESSSQFKISQGISINGINLIKAGSPRKAAQIQLLRDVLQS